MFRLSNVAYSAVSRWVKPPSLRQIAAGIVLAPVLIPAAAAVMVVEKVKEERKKRKPKELVQKTYVAKCSDCEAENSIQIEIEKDDD